ncbi:hypothetical protein, conserved [Trypanosoma brucei gambiense DAL972]|uniref:Uncharacterized protein n=1 Tax=Trypanosoma brucei gambiense (strain MHOM/CI/86/DAL972) TaxID=679716 RepID=C9ZL27_TRYB9|nr:hypothetical protein, conserved [Trypanosoma brucei gambiense DAL972]CBH10036.1 hypothetical protein, conserved [Trypanosoma brucei gambiense DAL972]|eukprot:XP_011772326.1 hypothetical protein, conserved [Trypanosoma brucei gambiense DAL972]
MLPSAQEVVEVRSPETVKLDLVPDDATAGPEIAGAEHHHSEDSGAAMSHSEGDHREDTNGAMVSDTKSSALDLMEKPEGDGSEEYRKPPAGTDSDTCDTAAEHLFSEEDGEEEGSQQEERDEGSYEDRSEDEEEVEGEPDGEGSDEEQDVMEQEEDYGFVLPPETSKDAVAKVESFVINGKKYTASSFVHNAGFRVLRELKGKKARDLVICASRKPHNILSCKNLHLTNRAVCVKDCYLRLNTLVNNPGKEALLVDPTSAATALFCERTDADHDQSACTALHLMPGIVYVGFPPLRVGYFEGELHKNIALTRLQEGSDTCGTWCAGRRSHIVVTCSFVHYNRGTVYKEAPSPPALPTALFPGMQPREHVGRGRGRNPLGRGRGARGRGGLGRGRGCGAATEGHDRSNNARGRGRGASKELSAGRGRVRPVNVVAAQPPLSSAVVCEEVGGVAPPPEVAITEGGMRAHGVQFLNFVLVLLSVIIAVLVYMLM